MPIQDEPLPEAFIRAILSDILREEAIRRAFFRLQTSSSPDSDTEEEEECSAEHYDDSELSDDSESLSSCVSSPRSEQPLPKQQSSNEHAFCQLFQDAFSQKLTEFPRLKNSNSATLSRLFQQFLPKDQAIPQQVSILFDRIYLQLQASQMKNNIPECGVLLEELRKSNSGAVADSWNGVKKATLNLNGQKQSVFFKPCTDDYPPLLAQYAVAASVLYRSVLGSRAAEERLVFNDHGQIVGSVSFEIPGFTPLTHESTYHLTSAQLIELKATDVLVAMWRLMEDDAHPGNLGLAVIDGELVMVKIDEDMSFYNITHIIKGSRITRGLLQDGPYAEHELKAKHIQTFPCGGGRRGHWPTEDPITKHQKKYFACKEAFILLNQEPQFAGQLHSALLANLLSFQDEMVHKELRRYLGNTPYGFNELQPSQKADLIQLFGEHYFFKPGSNQPLNFVEHLEIYLEQEYQKYYRIVTQDHSFLNYLLTVPKVLLHQINEFRKQKNSSPFLTLNVKKLERHFEKIFNDSLYAHACDFIKKLGGQLPSVQQELTGKKGLSNPLQTPIIPSSIGKTPNSVYSDSTRTDSQSFSHQTNKESFYRSLCSLFKELKSATKDHFLGGPPYPEANQQSFFSELQAKIESFEIAFIQQEAPLSFSQIKIWQERSIAFCQKVRFSSAYFKNELPAATGLKPAHQESPKRKIGLPIGESKKPKSRSTKPAPEVSELDRKLLDALIFWLSKQSFTSFKQLVTNDALREYAPFLSESVLAAFNPLYYKKNRKQEITRYAQSTYQKYQDETQEPLNATRSALNEKKLNNSQAIAYLLQQIYNQDNEGGWETTSYNYILLKLMVEKMFVDFERDPTVMRVDEIGQEEEDDDEKSTDHKTSSTQARNNRAQEESEQAPPSILELENALIKRNKNDESALNTRKLRKMMVSSRHWLENIEVNSIPSRQQRPPPEERTSSRQEGKNREERDKTPSLSLW